MAKYRSSATALAKIFERSSSLVYLVDQDGTVSFANPACEAWLGAESGSLFGKTLVYSSDSGKLEGSPEERINLLAPPPDVFVNRGEKVDPIRFLICGPGKSNLDAPDRYRWALAIQLYDPEQDDLAALIVSQSGDLMDKPMSSPDHSTANQAHVALLELRRQSQLTYRSDSLIGVSPFANRLRRQASMAAASNIDVYVCGPAGSGKEHLARTIHACRQQSNHRDLIPIHCTLADAAMIQALFQELNQKKQPQTRRKEIPGSDTSANLVAHPVLLLINMDRLHSAAQAELYRHLNSEPSIDCVIATGERSLKQLATEGAYHKELANLVGAMTIDLLPLWQRVEDIPLLAQRMLERPDRKKAVAGFDAAAIQLLIEYRWPGNLDQLREFVTQSGEQAQDRLLTPEDLPKKFHDCLMAQRLAPAAETVIDLESFLQSIERELILRAVGQAKGNKSQAANLLGLSRAKLLRRIEALSLISEIEQFFPTSDSSKRAAVSAVDLQSEKPSRNDRPSRLRDKLRKKTPMEELRSKSDGSQQGDSAEMDDGSDRDWVTPDAFEEIE